MFWHVEFMSFMHRFTQLTSWMKTCASSRYRRTQCTQVSKAGMSKDHDCLDVAKNSCLSSIISMHFLLNREHGLKREYVEASFVGRDMFLRLGDMVEKIQHSFLGAKSLGASVERDIAPLEMSSMPWRKNLHFVL